MLLMMAGYVKALQVLCSPTWRPMRIALAVVLSTDKADAIGTYAMRTQRAPVCTTPVAP